MAEAVNDQSPRTIEMLGELPGYVEITRNAVLLAEEHAYDRGEGVWFPDGRPLHPMRALLATLVPAGERHPHHASAATTCWPRPAGRCSTTPGCAR